MTEFQNDPPAPMAEGEAREALPTGERIAKFLAHAGVASRRDAEKLIAEGRVKINGKQVTHPSAHVLPGDKVVFDNKLLAAPERARLFRYHKPAGLVTTHKDPQGRTTVFSQMPAVMGRVVSVGRLDLNSEGLLLLTNDGELARQLELPSNGWLRRYRARVHGDVTDQQLEDLSRGITIEGVKYGSIEAALDSKRGANAWLSVGLREGKNREIRRVMQHLGLHVTRLIRISYGPFQLGTLERGAIAEVPPKVIREQLGDPPQEKGSGT